MPRKNNNDEEAQIDVLSVLAKQREYLVCTARVNIFQTFPGSEIRPVRRKGLMKFMNLMRSGGFDHARNIKVFCKTGLPKKFFEEVDAVRDTHIKNDIQIPVLGVYMKNQELLDEVTWSLDDGAHRVAACKKLYDEHALAHPDKKAERDQLYKYVKATIYKSEIQENGEILERKKKRFVYTFLMDVSFVSRCGVCTGTELGG